MKTKNLMTAFALSAMFAACSQDTELNETIAKNDFSNIPMVEANFTVNTGVDSRMATGWGWELQDKVGFAWLGDGTEITPDGKAYQNNPLYCIDTKGAFSAEGMFYVGKYFAYMPYTEGKHAVEAINFNVSGQPLTTSSASLAKHAIYISPEVYTLVKEDADGNVPEGNLPSGIGKNLPLTIARVSNAATINLTFANTDGLEDLKVLGVSLDATGNEGNSLLPKSFTYAPKTGANIEKWTKYGDLNIGAVTTYTVGAIAATSKEGIAVVDNALTINMLTMPVEETADGINIVVTTNYGTVTVTEESVYDAPYNEPCITYGEDEDGSEYVLADSPIFNALGASGELNVYVDMAKIAVTDSDVKTQAELEQQLNLLVVSGYENEVKFNVVPETANRDKNFVFTDFTLPEGLKAKVTLTADGTKVKEGFVFNGTTLINKQVVLGENAVVNGTMQVNYLEDEDGNPLEALEIGADKVLKINNEAVLVNNGVIKGAVTTIAYNAATKKAAGKYLSNADDAAHTGLFTNSGAIQWIAGTLPSSSTGLIYAEVYDFASLAAASSAKVTTARFVENTTFGNNGLSLNNNEFVSIKYVEIYAPVTINVTKNGVTGDANTIEFGGLANTNPFPSSGETAAFQIMEGASLTVVSDLKDNTINFGANAVMTMAEETELNLTKVTFAGLAEIKNKGQVTTNSSVLTASITGTGSNSSSN